MSHDLDIVLIHWFPELHQVLFLVTTRPVILSITAMFPKVFLNLSFTIVM